MGLTIDLFLFSRKFEYFNLQIFFLRRPSITRSKEDVGDVESREKKINITSCK